MSEIQLALLLFVVVWVVTFIPAWRILLKLLALSASKNDVGLKLWAWVIIYRLLIAAPYIVLLVIGAESFPDVLTALIVGIVVAGFLFSIIRFVYKDKLISWLWYIYGFVYDGLLKFAPYNQLLTRVVATAKNEKPDAVSILELGSGTGNVLRLLISAFPAANITGVDNSASMTRAAVRKVPGAQVIQQDAVEYVQTRGAETYDLIVMQNFLYALESRKGFWESIHRLLRPGGVIVVSNSDRAGNITIIKEHLASGKWYALLNPRLLLVGLIDAYISQLSKTGSFHFIEEDILRDETKGVYVMSSPVRCYGGVNILFSLKKVSHE